MEKGLIINLTNHGATTEQLEEGVFEPSEKIGIQKLITFNSIPTVEELEYVANQLSLIAKKYDAKKAMIGGSQFLLPFLVYALLNYGVEPVFSFTQRLSVDKRNPDGSIIKTSIFKHEGFVRPYKGFLYREENQ